MPPPSGINAFFEPNAIGVSCSMYTSERASSAPLASADTGNSPIIIASATSKANALFNGIHRVSLVINIYAPIYLSRLY